MRRSLLPAVPLLALTACTPEPTCFDWCGTAVAAFYGDAETLLPPLAETDIEFAVSDQLFLKLADIGPGMNTERDLGFVPLLADRWQFEDPRTISFTLNPAARWHDGTPVTAADVVFTFDTYRNPRVSSPARPRLKEIVSVTARDSQTVVFRYRRAYPEQFFDAVYHMRVIPSHLLSSTPAESLRTAPLSRAPVGNGPFRFVRWEIGESGELAADSTFFLGRPGLRRFIWRVAPDPATGVNQLLAEEADLLHYVIPTAANVRLIDESDHLDLVEFPSNTYNFVAFNLKHREERATPHPLFGNRDVRRAIAMAVNTDEMTEAVLGDFGERLPGPITRILWIWNADYSRLPYDTARARALLGRSGWRDADGDGVLDRNGQRLSFAIAVPTSSSSRVQSSVIMQEQLKRVGIEMNIERLEWGTYIDRINEGRFDAHFASVAQDPSLVSLEDWTSAGLDAFNYGAYVNPDVDRLIREALDTFDRSAALEIWQDAINLINDDAPAVWAYLPKIAAAVHTRLENVSLRPDAWWSGLWTWRVAPSRLIQRDRFAGR